MSNARKLADLLDSNGDVKLTHLDNTDSTDVLSDTSPELGGDLDTNGKNISFGDSSGSTDDRLTFGASDDLQIYHDGSHSIISDSGTGSIKIKVGDFRVENASGENLIKGVGDVASLYNAGAEKLATTDSGIDVTGTVTADALTVSTTGTNAFLKAQDTTGAARVQLTNTVGNILLGVDTHSGGITGVADQAFAYSATPLKFGIGTLTASAMQLEVNSTGIDVWHLTVRLMELLMPLLLFSLI